MTNLSSWNVTNSGDGRKNLKIVSSIPLSAYAPSSTSSSNPTPAPVPLPEGAEIFVSPLRRSHPKSSPPSLLRITYPAHSSDPSLSPIGGTDFYATPLPLSPATSVTLSYSVFFPYDFDFVRGGKLPGLYGGEYECSAGRSAEWCWSSRLMWRREGAGELYLYAPKVAQTAALCSTPPLTICDSADGQSIGRGSFNFTRGGWTEVRQTVVLNTPGEWDGAFELWADGKLVIQAEGVYWRNTTRTTTAPDEPVGFSGIFFSTFFGGSGPEWETQVETHAWFKDFELVVDY
ncbi:polysaccharide lyase family 14 protein [Calocera cornea HHB12733]|uniref:Polysaccharide lyase family 14 protein n=1 Tax=Calocera cornea HHB12733 TaxID=1353952 RepID=A0A165E977_9BASI|nr:polysaccharide lyase family 14 protein [Calocera cornea HHB12733]